MTTQRKARGAYSVGQATRESILSAAMVLIAERGYNGFSLRDLGRRVGISHPAVVYHFPSKEAILRSAIQRHEEMNALFDVSINEEAEGGFDEGGITASSFVDWAVGEMRFAMKPGADAAIALDCVLWAESSSETHPAHAHYKYRTQQMEEALTSMITAFVEDEGADIGTIPRTLAKILIRYWYGSVVSARYNDEPIDAREFVADFLAVCVQLLHLPAHYVLQLGASVPEEVAEVYARTLRKISEKTTAAAEAAAAAAATEATTA